MADQRVLVLGGNFAGLTAALSLKHDLGDDVDVSKHLGILHAAGMVSRTKEGNHTRYAISDPSVFELCDQACGASSKSSTRSW